MADGPHSALTIPQSDAMQNRRRACLWKRRGLAERAGCGDDGLGCMQVARLFGDGDFGRDSECFWPLTNPALAYERHMGGRFVRLPPVRVPAHGVCFICPKYKYSRDMS